MFILSEALKWLKIGDQLLALSGLNKHKKKHERCYPCPSAGKTAQKHLVRFFITCCRVSEILKKNILALAGLNNLKKIKTLKSLPQRGQNSTVLYQKQQLFS
jgi:hypothetical protein